MAFPTFPVELAWKRHVTPHVWHLGFRRADGEALSFVAGQFVNVHFETPEGGTHRSYSVANPPEAGNGFEIAVSPVPGGLATQAFGALEPGETVAVSGPYGRFVLRDDPPCRYLLVGTGTGITPYRAMLPELVRRLEDGFRAHVVLGVWRREELLFGKDFLALAEARDDFRFTGCYSREMPDDVADWERPGYVQTLYSQLELDPASDVVYLCGNPGMIDESMEILKSLGFESRQLRREKYLSARPAR
jgi:ferredoxin-NADP reductase